jgi:hypothetical protein
MNPDDVMDECNERLKSTMASGPTAVDTDQLTTTTTNNNIMYSTLFYLDQSIFSSAYHMAIHVNSPTMAR